MNADATKYKSSEDQDRSEKKTLLGGRHVGQDNHRIVSSQDMRAHHNKRLSELEISQIKEETNSKEGTSMLTRNKSNFLGSAASPYGEDNQI